MDENLTITLTPAMMAIVPVVAALLQVAKTFPIVVKFKAYMPVFSIVIAGVIAHLAKVEDPYMAGVLIGLASSTGYDLFKGLTTTKK